MNYVWLQTLTCGWMNCVLAVDFDLWLGELCLAVNFDLWLDELCLAVDFDFWLD